jgi:diguanylate cyclase (GGDEF)-like protein
LNARAFARQCEPLMQLAQRQGGDHSVLFIDLDHFKRVNDQHGHEAGDAVLKAVAAALSQRLRRSDLLGRVGGEEFVAFLPGTDEAGALQLAESLRHDIEALQPASASGLVVPITASIGVASRGAQAESLAVLQQRADVAMYQAKAAGRNRVSRIAGAGPESEEPQGHRPFASHASGAWG